MMRLRLKTKILFLLAFCFISGMAQASVAVFTREQMLLHFGLLPSLNPGLNGQSLRPVFAKQSLSDWGDLVAEVDSKGIVKINADEEKRRANGQKKLDEIERLNKIQQAKIAAEKRKAGMHYNEAYGEWQK